MFEQFPIIIVNDGVGESVTEGLGIRALIDTLESKRVQVITVNNYGELSAFAQQQSRASSFVVFLDDVSFHSEEVEQTILNLSQFIEAIRLRNEDIPIFLYGKTSTNRQLPNSILRELHGFIDTMEDTPEFIASYILREARNYLKSLPPPFFRALTQYAADGAFSWHCPGHSGGVAFLKSPVGQMFHKFFGENMLRADVCNSVEELGQLLDHTGAVAEAERNAARIIGCDHLFFVTNGTSTSNKIVWHANVAPNDIVVVDRNCHKSVLHAIIMTGAIPVFLTPSRNHYGIIGPIDKAQFSIANIQQKIEQHPLVGGLQNKSPVMLTLTQSTYDGIIYNTDMIKLMLDAKIPTLLFDEAWLPHAVFHDFYQHYHAIAKGENPCKQSMVFSTQSTHKLLAGLSQASQILVQEPQQQKLDRALFNEAYLMHTSTSPQYAIIASCDVAIAMMEEPAGKVLVEESLYESCEFRRAMLKVSEDFAKDDWWFKVWGPDSLVADGIGNQQDWMLGTNQKWHGFGQVAEGFNMLDPIKASVITPGLDIEGEFAQWGIPANILTHYLAEHGIIVEKTGLYSFFIMFTIGITKGRWNTLLSELQQFKTDHDRNRPLWRCMPEFAEKFPIYEKIGLKDICQKIHLFYQKYDVARMTTQMYLNEIVPAMKPSDAYAQLARKQVERVEIDALEGRVSAVLVTPYPPGIPLLIPGERFTKDIVSYLQFVHQLNQDYPGFDTDVHGLIRDNDTKKYYVDCVKELI